MEENDDTFSDSFEVLPQLTSFPQSMSIITIPYERVNENSNLLASQSSIASPTHETDTTRVTSIDMNQLEHQEINGKLMNLKLENQQQTCVKSFGFDYQLMDTNGGDMTEPESIIKAMDVLMNELSSIREDNEKLRAAIVYNNNTMKQQLERLQESQLQMHNNKKEHETDMIEANMMIEKLKNENVMLKERIKEMESNAGLKWMDDLGFEVASLRSKVDQYDKYESIKEQMLLENKEISEKLNMATDELSNMTLRNVELQSQLNSVNNELETIPVMKQQIEIYERDFRIEELTKNAALKENECFTEEIRQLKADKIELEKELEKYRPVSGQSSDSAVGHHRRRHSKPKPHSGKL